MGGGGDGPAPGGGGRAFRISCGRPHWGLCPPARRAVRAITDAHFAMHMFGFGVAAAKGEGLVGNGRAGVRDRVRRGRLCESVDVLIYMATDKVSCWQGERAAILWAGRHLFVTLSQLHEMDGHTARVHSGNLGLQQQPQPPSESVLQRLVGAVPLTKAAGLDAGQRTGPMRSHPPPPSGPACMPMAQPPLLRRTAHKAQ